MHGLGDIKTAQKLTMPVIRLHMEVLGSCGERTMTMSFLQVKETKLLDMSSTDPLQLSLCIQ